MSKTEETKEPENSKSIKWIFNTFQENLESVRFYFEKFGEIAEHEDKGGLEIQNEHNQRLLDLIGLDLEKPIEEQEKKEVPVDKIFDFFKEVKKGPTISLRNFEILSTSSFLILNNYFEYLISDLLTYYYTNFKDFLKSREFKISLKEMNEYETIQELEEYLILKEVETMLIEMSFDSLLKHFEQKLKVNLSDGIVEWNIINEYGKRWGYGGSSLSISGGISFNFYLSNLTDENDNHYKTNEKYLGFPFEVNFKWFKSENKKSRILYGLISFRRPTSFGGSFGFKNSRESFQK